MMAERASLSLTIMQGGVFAIVSGVSVFFPVPCLSFAPRDLHQHRVRS